MSKNSKARRDAKKKKSSPVRAAAAPKLGASTLALLKVDGAVFAAMTKVGAEWSLLVGGAPVAGASDPQAIVGIMQAIAYRAESNDNEASVQCSDKLRPLLGEPDSDAAEAQYDALAKKILATHPLPNPIR